MNSQADLMTYREMAAQDSRGISSSAIYEMFERSLVQHSSKGTLLDFGAGVGNLTQHLIKMNRFDHITAVDMLSRPLNIDNNIKWIAQDLNHSLSLPDKSFDVIVSSEVIEHLENPRATAREWFRLLRPDGILLFSTPNNESWRSILALIAQGNFVAFGESSYPSHITALVRQDIRHIMNEARFCNVEFDYTNVGGIPKLPSVKWQKLSGGLLRGLRFSDNILAISRK